MPIDATRRVAALSDEQRQLLAKRLAGRSQAGQSQDKPAFARTTIPRRNPDTDLLPLSFAQQRIWFVNQLDPSSRAWSVGRPIRLRGELQVEALRKSVNEIVRRHESLRTVFPVTGATPMQRVLPFSEHRVDVIDLSDLAVEDRGTEALRQIVQVYHQPWPLERGPLVRATLWRLAEDDHVLLFLTHHILADGWAWGLVERELTTLYQAFNEGRPSPLAELPIQYPDFAVWQNQWVESGDCERQITWWKSELAGMPQIALPPDRPDPGGGAVTHHLELSPELTKALKALCRREGATLFMGLLTAFAALLSRYTAQDDIVIGSPIANRNRPEVENVIGCFMNPLPLRIDVSGNPSFATLLRQVRERALSVYEHQDVPFDLLVRVLQPKRDSSSPPLFQSMLLVQNFPWDPLTLSPSNTGGPDEFARRVDELGFELEHGDLVYPIAIKAYERGEDVLCVLQHESAYKSVLARVREHFLRLLEGGTAEPDRPVGNLSILTVDETRRLLSQERAARVTEPPLVHRRFEIQAEQTPDAVAVVAGERSMTYAELDARANQLAHYLRSRGVKPDSLVGILLPRSSEMIVTLLAVLKAGGAYVPLDPAYPVERLAFTLRDSASALLLTTQELLDQLPGVLASAPGVAAICLDVEAGMVESLDRTAPVGQPAAANLAYVIYTSGSTGVPKGVQITHEAVAAYTDVACEAFELKPTDRVLQFASISFDTAAEEIYPCLARGAALVLRTNDMIASVPSFLRSCNEWGITVLDLPTAYWHELTHVLTRQGLTLPATVRLVILGGERAHADAARAWQTRFGTRTRLLNTYGPTEATIVTTMHEVGRLEAGAPLAEVPIGCAIPSARAYVLDRHLQPVTIGAPGELHIAGVGLSRGYLRRPDLTAEKFVPNPFAENPGERLYKTGDLARVREDGTIEFLGRVDHQIKLRGYRIELAEIEAALMRDSAVHDAIVTLRDDAAGGKRIVAHVVACDRSVISSDLRQRLRGSLPDYMVPSAFVLLDTMPLTPSGKIDRDALPLPAEERSTGDAHALPQTAVHRTLMSIWQELLGVERFGIDDNFFDLGGHSLLVLRLHSRLHDAFEDVPSVVDLFRFSTIRALADHLGGPDAGSVSAPADDLVTERADRQREAFRRRRQAAQVAVDGE